MIKTPLLLILSIFLLVVFGSFILIFQNIFSIQNETNKESATNLLFTSGDCKIPNSPQDSQGVDVFNVNWLNDSTLQVKTSVMLNCKDEIVKGDYKIENNNINLEYKVKDCDICAKCFCINELIYQINKIEKQDYLFSLKKIN